MRLWGVHGSVRALLLRGARGDSIVSMGRGRRVSGAGCGAVPLVQGRR